MAQREWLSEYGAERTRNNLVEAAKALTLLHKNPDEVTPEQIAKLESDIKSKTMKMDDRELTNRLNMAQEELHKAFIEKINS